MSNAAIFVLSVLLAVLTVAGMLAAIADFLGWL
jgi:hypothetical protein